MGIALYTHGPACAYSAGDEFRAGGKSPKPRRDRSAAPDPGVEALKHKARLELSAVVEQVAGAEVERPEAERELGAVRRALEVGLPSQ